MEIPASSISPVVLGWFLEAPDLRGQELSHPKPNSSRDFQSIPSSCHLLEDFTLLSPELAGVIPFLAKAKSKGSLVLVTAASQRRFGSAALHLLSAVAGESEVVAHLEGPSGFVHRSLISSYPSSPNPVQSFSLPAFQLHTNSVMSKNQCPRWHRRRAPWKVCLPWAHPRCFHPFPRLFFSCQPFLLGGSKHRQLQGFHLSVLPLVLPTQSLNLPSNACCTGSLSSNPRQLKSLAATTFHLPEEAANLPLEWLLCFLFLIFCLCSSSAHFSFSSPYSETITHPGDVTCPPHRLLFLLVCPFSASGY